MSVVSVELPASLHEQATRLADKEKVPLDRLIALALAEKVSALMTEEYLEERAKRGSKAKFLKALDKVPDVPAEDHDRL